MASIKERKRKSGSVFLAEIRLRGFPSISKTFKRHQEAKHWAIQTEAALISGSLSPSIFLKEKTLSDAIERYLKHPLKGEEDKVARYAWMLKFWDFHLGAYLISEITPALIYQSREKLITNPSHSKKAKKSSIIRYLKPATINRHQATLSSVFNRAVMEWGFTNSNPVLQVKRLKEKNQRHRYLDESEIKSLLNQCKSSMNQDLYDFVLLALCTGARRGELRELKWSDVDLESSLVIFKNTKNGENKIIPLVSEIKEMMRIRYFKRMNQDGLVFGRYDQPIKVRDFRKAFDNAVKRAELKDFRFHDLRHTASTYLALLGIPIRDIADILGHKSMQMTMRYSHLNSNRLQGAMIELNKKIRQIV